jgi:hypothetical protein
MTTLFDLLQNATTATSSSSSSAYPGSYRLVSALNSRSPDWATIRTEYTLSLAAAAAATAATTKPSNVTTAAPVYPNPPFFIGFERIPPGRRQNKYVSDIVLGLTELGASGGVIVKV